MYHELVEGGQYQYEVATGQKVRVVKVSVRGTFEVVLPDHKDEEGNVVGHGGTIGLRNGDYLCGREDGSLFGVQSADYSKLLSSAPLAIPVVKPQE